MKQKVKSKAKIKWTERIVALSLVAVFLLAVLFSRVIYREYILRTPSETDFSRSFSHELFEFQSSEIGEIYVSVQEKGETDSQNRRRAIIDTPEQLHEIAEYLNSFRYHFWMPGPKMIVLSAEEWDALNVISITMKAKGHAPYPLVVGDEFHILFDDHRMLINRVWYYGDKEFFEKLTELAEQFGHPRGE